jgi:hypothetical protein
MISCKERSTMDNSMLRQIEASFNNLQAQVNALKAVMQTYHALELYQHRNPRAMSNFSRNSKAAVERFESYTGDQADDEAMKSRMRIFVHDYLDEIQVTLKAMPPRG